MALVEDPAFIRRILGRESVVTFRAERPPRALIERLLDVAITAPNHHLNQPWRFTIIAGSERGRFAQSLRECLAKRISDVGSEQSRARLDAAARKAFRAPVVIVAASCATEDTRALRHEDDAATAAAIAHIVLAAHGFGLGAYWRTGDAAGDPDVKADLGLDPDDRIVGFVHVGYPDVTRPMRPRRPASEVTSWRGWDG
jgi:nitroreductase